MRSDGIQSPGGFSRSALNKVGQRETGVTCWVGATSVVVAISIPSIAPEDLRVSVSSSQLVLRGSGRRRSFFRVADLPCAVEANPLQIRSNGETLYLLFPKAPGGPDPGQNGPPRTTDPPTGGS